MSDSDHDLTPPRGTVRPRDPETPTPTRPSTSTRNGDIIRITPLSTSATPRPAPPKKRRTDGPVAATYSAAARTAPPAASPATRHTRPPRLPEVIESTFDIAAKGFAMYRRWGGRFAEQQPVEPENRSLMLIYLMKTLFSASIQYDMLVTIGWPDDAKYAQMENFDAFLRSRMPDSAETTPTPTTPSPTTTPAPTAAPMATPTPNQPSRSNGSAQSQTPLASPGPTAPPPGTAGPPPSGTQKPARPPPGDKQGYTSTTRPPLNGHKTRSHANQRPAQGRPTRQPTARSPARPSTRLLVNIAGSNKTLQSKQPHPARLRVTLNSALPAPMVASTSFASNGQLVIHTAQPHTAQQLAIHQAMLWPAIRSAFGLEADMASPEFEPDDAWSKVVISNVPLPVADGHVDIHTVRQELLAEICRSNGVAQSSVRRARWLCSDDEALRRASSSLEANPTFVAVMIALSDHRQATSLRTHGAVCMGANCRVSAYRPRARV